MRCLLAVAVAVATGCAHNVYEIELTPQGDVVHRTLTCWHARSGEEHAIDPQLAERLGRLYAEGAVQSRGARLTLAARFGAEMPDDVGGAGYYQAVRTSLGSAYTYSERFRGDDDLEAQSRRRAAAAQRLSELFLQWSQQEFGQAAGYEHLARFVRQRLQHDLCNLGHYAYLATSGASNGAADDHEALTAAAVRMAHYLLERRYLTLGELPQAYRALATGDGRAACRFVGRWLAARMRLDADEALRGPLQVFDSPQRLRESWEAFLRDTPEYRQRQEGQPEAEPLAVVEELLVQLLGNPPLLQASDRLTLRLRLDERPYAGNGRWDAAQRAMVWSTAEIDRAFPTHCFAMWSEPDVAFQTAHFGRVILAGAELAEYCLWYASLSPREAAQWDALLARQRPSGEGMAALEEFRFQGEPASGMGPSLADRARELLLPKLQSPGADGACGP
jgi:hypothetical protein